MNIQLLGPVELRRDDGTPSDVLGAKRRAVLALLALELNRPVAVERFFELIWGDDPPAQARSALQGHVAALRKALKGSLFTLLTRSPGYVLIGDTDAVDAHRFDSLVAEAAAADDADGAASLQEALDLWHGTALADLPDTDLRAALVSQLTQSRTQALAAWADIQLRLGNGSLAVSALDRQLRADWLHEPTAALLIRCLQQDGRLAEAINVYQRVRTGLDEELGILPGSLLQKAFTDALADQEPVPAPVRATRPAGDLPRSGARLLPRLPSHFVGRARESLWLDEHGKRKGAGCAVVVVAGPAGVGKTATVVRWAHSAADYFPDGQLFVDLQGFDPAGPLDPSDALAAFLTALGVSEAAIPEDFGARVTLFRKETQHRRLLVVLDNARSHTGLADLIPAGPASAAVITSRSTLEELIVTEGAAHLRMEAFPPGDALRLLEQVLPPARVDAERAAAERLTALCDHLPLALRIAAARLASQPTWTVASLVEALEDERTRLHTLDTQGAASVRSALNLTVRLLPPEEVRLLALLAVHPGREVDVHASAALLGSSVREARRALGTLASHHLLTETAPHRFGRHDLVRLFGAELLAEHPTSVRREAVVALLDYECAAASVAAAMLQPQTQSLPPSSRWRDVLPPMESVRSALDWFRSEEPTIRALVSVAADETEYERAWRLARLAGVVYGGTGPLTGKLGCLRAGLRSAITSGNRAAVSSLESATARALGKLGRHEEALALASRAVARTGPEDGGVHIEAVAVLATVTASVGDLAEAIRLSDTALGLTRATGRHEHAAAVLSNAAAFHGLTGDGAAALRCARRARGLLARHPEATAHLIAMVNEAHALQVLGHTETSEAAWLETLDRCDAAGAVLIQATAERQFTDFLVENRRFAEAADHLRTAIALYTALADARTVGELEERLSALPM
ncbi:SARP family transcriptional regulator [Kitasatospora sp. NE20-6]